MSITEIPLDISTYLLPVSGTELFNNSNYTALEIGFGEGEFIVELSKKYSEWNFVGIEVKYYRYLKALNLARKEDVQNLKLIHIEAAIALEQVFCVESFERVYINFPDPWPKEKHAKHRLINDNFLKDLHRIMRKGAVIEFVTDSGEYADNTSYCFDDFHGFKINDEVPEINSDRPVTRFQKEFNKQSKKIYFLSYIKTG